MYFSITDRRGHENAVLLEVRNNFTDVPERIQEHEIGVRIDGAKHAGAPLTIAVPTAASPCKRFLRVIGMAQILASRKRTQSFQVTTVPRGGTRMDVRNVPGRDFLLDSSSSESVTSGSIRILSVKCRKVFKSCEENQ
jgi:hypothetical protein